jgi:hypothetical protein
VFPLSIVNIPLGRTPELRLIMRAAAANHKNR